MWAQKTKTKMPILTKTDFINKLFEAFSQKGSQINFNNLEDFRFPDIYDIEDVQDEIRIINENLIKIDGQFKCPSGVNIKYYYSDGQYIYHKDYPEEWFLIHKLIATKFIINHNKQFCKQCGNRIRKNRKRIICQECFKLPIDISYQVYRGKCHYMSSSSMLPWEQDIKTLWRLQVSNPTSYFLQLKTPEGQKSFAELTKWGEHLQIHQLSQKNEKNKQIYKDFKLIMRIIYDNLSEVTIEGLDIIY